MKEIVIANLSLDFALRIVNLYKYLCDEKSEFVMSKQLLRCGTSIGANIAESDCASSTGDFLNKIYIALKECSETCYWLELLRETDYLSESEFNSLYSDCMEMKRMMQSTTKTLKEKH